ncbi:5'-nucleotidase/2',3'-cyclic phosphodiesterase [Nostoc sp. NIES-3756]|uniref:choice-of-anchor I family protein n=1 Tax=Nostoc sp. NIES-3756 TaxID=1751286 RepID=UPI000721BE6E|nr:choice-of-anchor I family protein [Nostoc sp. NIES-3756]BAT53969.1 5'-nucleotidase/2',3'-cyclic phosphodiesterase [Nostoc sp. NIES-3756]
MALTVGSIAFVGFNADGSDNIAFVALTDINPGELIIFEDNEWNGTSFNDTNEGAFSWTATSLVPAGTIVRIDNIGSGSITANTGTVVTPVSGRGSNRGIAADNEAIYVYQGSATSPTFITAIANSGFTPTTGLLTNTGLTVGVNALDLSTVDTGADIAAYVGTRGGQANFSDYLSLINNAANWITQDAAGDQSADNIAPDLPFSSVAFTVGSGTPSVNLSVSSNTGSEADQTVITVTVTASSAVVNQQTVAIGVSGTGITAGDYTLSNTTITIPDGQTSASVTFTVVDDVLVEGTETAVLAISNPSAGIALGNTTTQNITITDNESPAVPTVSITATDASASESSTTVNTGSFTITRTGDTTAALTVTYTIGGTATNGSDYNSLTGSVVIPAGQTSATITITPVNDGTTEGNETVTLTLVDGVSYDLGAASNATVNITDNTTGTLKKVGSFTSANGAEIPAFDPQSDRAFVVAGSTVEIYSVSNTGALTAAGSLNPGFTVSADNEIIPNSVAVKNGTVAVAYAIRNTTNNAQLPGRVSFFNAADGAFLNTVEVGYLPDMLTFTPDGTKVLTANEGEPNSYGRANSFDPEGSVSIINLANGVANATVQTAGFTTFNSQIDALKAAGVRIFGPGATVAQDLEPEYIAFSGDGTKAYVTLQENNALAILDIATATVTDIKPLGLKNHNQPTVIGLETYEFTNLPTLGTTAAGQDIPLGGFSGLTFEGYATNGNLKFITHTDRGPNGEPTGINRPFLLPDFAPEIIRFELNRTTGQLTITERIQLQDSTGKLLSGLPNTEISNNANQAFNDEVPVDLQCNILPRDRLGADLEGIVVAPDGTFWMVDEYRPSIYHFNSSGVLIDRFIPVGTSAAAGQPVGTFGKEVLPQVLGQRRQNRGFEAVAFQDGKVYAFVQSPLRNPETLSNGILNGLQNIRIVEFDPTTQTTRQFLYIMDNPPAVSATDTRADKIGDAVAIGNGEFLVLERDDDAIDSDSIEQIQKKIYRFSLADATDISSLPNVINGKTLDQMTLAELQTAGVKPIVKTLHVDLATAGYNTVEKIEGLTIIDRNTLAVVNDNDFTVAGITIDPTTGTFTPDPNAETPTLGLISLRDNSIDPSDRDNSINIRPVPVFGMYQPDAIASYTVNGQTYYITANEGDARDYTGFSEEIRVSDASYNLDDATFPTETTLKQNANLGRLNVTKATGDIDGDGDFDRIEAFGARSFSIWDSNGNQVFDSGDQLERITAAQVPSLFNSDGSFTSPNFDTRSDNKGPEPEGLVVGVINNRTYAFIGLERTGDVIVYEITDPTKPQFIEYINTPEDFAPEGLTFISAADSPTGKPLLVIANEVSRTVAVFEVTPPVRISDIQGTSHISPFNGQGVRNVQGIVSAIASNGFYIQDPNPDDNIATSEGIFIFTGSNSPILNARRVGEAVLVSGTVSEFRPGGSANNLTVTQIGNNNSVQSLSVSAWTTAPTTTITPTVLGNGGRTIPTQVINNDFASQGNVETGGDFDPVNEGIDFYESVEGMLVQVNNPVATSPTGNFGSSEEIWVLADNGANATNRTSRGGSLITASDFNPERIQIDDLINGAITLPSVNVGAQLSTITGVVSYDFNNYEVLTASAPTVVQPSPLQKEVTNLTGSATQLTVATFNVENLDPGDGAGKFNALAAAIVNNLSSPDIISLEEIQDNNGAINDSVVDANVTFQALIDAIAKAGGPTYQYRQINPVDDQDGGEPGGNIRVGFLFNPNRVGFVAGSLQRLTDTNLADGDAFASSRKPLVGRFTFNGQQITVVGNHFNSKGGDQPLFGPNQPPTLSSEVQRNQQATIVKNYVQAILASNPNANVIVAGDLNDFEFSQPLTILESAGLNTLIETLPENERYTYNFQGNAQTLDHILTSNNLLSLLDGFDVVHINSEFADQISDHDPVIAQFNIEAGITLNGGNGQDTLNGRAGDDNINGGNGNDTLFGNRGNDSLLGSNGDDILWGGAGVDTLNGGFGDDILIGGLGNDILTGSRGIDRFVYNNINEGTDTITDFYASEEILDLRGVFQSLGVSSVTSDFLRFTQSSRNTLVQIDQNGALGGADFNTLVTLERVNANDLGIGTNVLV